MNELRDRIAEAFRDVDLSETRDAAQAVIDALRIEEHVTVVHGGKAIRKDYMIGYSEEIHLSPHGKTPSGRFSRRD